MTNYLELLSTLQNFNIIKYTGHYVLTLDKGYGRPITFQGENLYAVLKELDDYLQRIARAKDKE